MAHKAEDEQGDRAVKYELHSCSSGRRGRSKTEERRCQSYQKKDQGRDQHNEHLFANYGLLSNSDAYLQKLK